MGKNPFYLLFVVKNWQKNLKLSNTIFQKLGYFISEKGKVIDTAKEAGTADTRNTGGSITREFLVFNDLNFIFWQEWWF